MKIFHSSHFIVNYTGKYLWDKVIFSYVARKRKTWTRENFSLNSWHALHKQTIQSTFFSSRWFRCRKDALDSQWITDIKLNLSLNSNFLFREIILFDSCTINAHHGTSVINLSIFQTAVHMLLSSEYMSATNMKPCI